MEESVKGLTDSLAEAIRRAVIDATQAAVANINTPVVKAPAFSMPEYKRDDGSTVSDYFQRFEWALQLSRIAQNEYQSYVRVHMGAELNTALKILVSPRNPESLTFKEAKDILINHFDSKINKYAESIKFRKIMQEKEESIADFTLRLKQKAVNCDYGDFLDRMLTEQLLCGMRSREICDEIIKKKPQTFAAAYEIAHTMELTHSTTTEIIPTSAEHALSEEVHKLQPSTTYAKRNTGDKRTAKGKAL